MKEQEAIIIQLKEAKKIVFNNYDILLTTEAEQLYTEAIKSLNNLINFETQTLETLEDEKI